MYLQLPACFYSTVSPYTMSPCVFFSCFSIIICLNRPEGGAVLCQQTVQCCTVLYTPQTKINCVCWPDIFPHWEILWCKNSGGSLDHANLSCLLGFIIKSEGRLQLVTCGQLKVTDHSLSHEMTVSSSSHLHLTSTSHFLEARRKQSAARYKIVRYFRMIFLWS